MQILKSLSLFCAAALSVAVVSAQDDTDAQTKAREALRQKLDELQRNPPPDTAPAPAPAAKPAPAPKVRKAPKPAPVTKAPAPVETTPIRRTPSPTPRIAEPTRSPAPTPEIAPEGKREPTPEVVAQPKSDSEALAKAREAMREKMNALEAQQPAPAQAAPPAPVERATPMPTPRPAPVVRTDRQMNTPRNVRAPQTTRPQPIAGAPSASNFSPQEPNVNGQAENSDVRRELDKREAEMAARHAANRPAPMPEQPRKGKRKESRAQAQNEIPTYQPLEAPALPISNNKHQQLQELLRRYQADELTPSQYHQERAKILAQP